jgi:hypothetical protein
MNLDLGLSMPYVLDITSEFHIITMFVTFVRWSTVFRLLYNVFYVYSVTQAGEVRRTRITESAKTLHRKYVCMYV